MREGRRRPSLILSTGSSSISGLSRNEGGAPAPLVAVHISKGTSRQRSRNEGGAPAPLVVRNDCSGSAVSRTPQ